MTRRPETLRLLVLPLFLAATIALPGCSKQADDTTDDVAVANTDDDDDPTDRLDFVITCATTLEAVAKLPPVDTDTNVIDESEPTDEAAEHAELGQLYRQRATTMVGATAAAQADLVARLKAAAGSIDRERAARAPDDFAAWVGGQADDCPAI